MSANHHQKHHCCHQLVAYPRNVIAFELNSSGRTPFVAIN
jgi:hypothetical protein